MSSIKAFCVGWWIAFRAAPYLAKYIFGRWYVFRDAPLDLVVMLAKVHWALESGDLKTQDNNTGFFREASNELERRCDQLSRKVYL